MAKRFELLEIPCTEVPMNWIKFYLAATGKNFHGVSAHILDELMEVGIAVVR